MTRFSHSSRSLLQLIAHYLVLSFLISQGVAPTHRSVRTSPRTEHMDHMNDDERASVPSPSPEPSTSPSPEASPTPEPMPTMTPTSNPSPPESVPTPELPNLDGLRYVTPEEPEVPAEVPSTRCSPSQPDCDPATGNPEPPSQISVNHHGSSLHSRLVNPMLRQSTLQQDNFLAWNDYQFSTPFFKYETWREAPDATVGTDAFFSLIEPPAEGEYDDFVMARLDPDNRIGTGSDDVLSRNFNWNLPLIEVAGRAGLNLGLSLSYNSLVWTRSGSYITFDADNGFPTPGFRLGFPVVYGPHTNLLTHTYGYLMLMPSGNRVELRQIGSTNVYESVDSSYMQLTDNEDGTLLVRSTDGAQLSYSFTDNGFRCSQVKDRNGNFLSISNNEKGRIESVIDTLGRVFIFNYDEKNNLISITQTRSGAVYTWVTFGYTNLTLQTGFSGLSTIGTQSGETIPVLTIVGLPDGTYYKFNYSSWGQVYKITNYAADSNPQSDSHPLNYVSYNLPLTSSTPQTDCPRFTQRKDWAENWNNGNEAVTNFAVPASATWTMPGGSQQSGKFCQMQSPNGVYLNVYSHSSGWDEGMPILINTYDNQVVLQRQETTTYTQDNTSVSYLLNPRIIETNIFDPAGNHKRTTISYSTSFGLPVEVKEYAANATTVLRTTQLDYNLGSDYTTRRIIGLVSQKRVLDTANGNALASKVDFLYDDDGEFLVQQSTPIQHDTNDYGSSFKWRGNLTRVKRWDVINTSQSLESKTGYNTTGSPIFTRSPLQTSNTQSNLIYTDSFSDSQNRNTFAYPTEATIKDTVGSSSALVTISNKTQYNFDTGAVTRTEEPPPAGQSQGAIITNAFDSADRLYLTTNAVNGAYVYVVYPANSNVIQTYTTIQSTQSATVSAKLLDGARRVRATASEHPGSVGGYVGQVTAYDVMGRVSATSNPTEIYGSWQPAGDDATGWVYGYQTYDWKGRPRVSTNQDGSTREVSYGGCGCAGGEIVTQRDEVNRYTRTYHDVLGRVSKSEELNWDQSVYRTTTNSFNARDQVTSSMVLQGTNGTAQQNLMTYEGYGRLATTHAPIQSSGAVTSYTYNSNDSIATTTDPRGAVTTFSYNNRKLTTGVTYSAPSGIMPSPAVSFAFDAAGNRTSMSDALGSVSYQYNQLSRLTSESRVFSSLGSTAYTLSYTYNPAGLVTNITDPWNTNVGYERDITGRLTAVTGTGYANVSQYATEFKYRAWGALKSMTYGNGIPLTLSYDNRLQVSNYKITSSSTLIPSPSMDIDYTYLADGRTQLSTDHKDAALDRAYKYDHVGRLVEAFTASEARSWVQTGNIGSTVDGPYRQSYTQDTWNNVTTKWGRSFTGSQLRNQTVSRNFEQSSGRIVSWEYDDAGNLVSGAGITNTYDAAGRLRYSDAGGTFEYDGDGIKTKSLTEAAHAYLLRSSVLGQTVEAINSTDGTRQNGSVYADGQLIATQAMNSVYWQHRDPSMRSMRTTDVNQDGVGRDELDPNGVKVDVPGANHFNSGSGGEHSTGAGGIQARIASLQNIGNCDFYEMTVPCSMLEQYQNTYDELPENLKLFWAHGLIIQGDYYPSVATTYVAAGKIDPILFGMLLNKQITASEFAESWMSGFMPLALPQDESKPNKSRLQSKLPQNPTPDQIRKEFFRKYQRKYTRCLWKVFGDDANKLPQQTLENAPDVNLQRTGSQIGGFGTNDSKLGSNGTVYISRDAVEGRGANRTNAILGTFAHEAANILDERLNPNGVAGRQYGGSYGNPSDVFDRDTGAAVERCVFGTLQYPDGNNIP